MGHLLLGEYEIHSLGYQIPLVTKLITDLTDLIERKGVAYGSRNEARPC